MASTLLGLGVSVALLGSFSLLRLPNFFERVHVPAIIATRGCWCVMWATVLFFSVQQGELAVFPLLTAVFIAITVPIPTIFLMRASLFRARQMGKDVPPSLSRTIPPGAQYS